MARVWSETTLYDTWLEVEIAVCEAWAADGEIDAESMRLIRGAGYDIDGINRALAEDAPRYQLVPALRRRTRWGRRGASSTWG